MPHPESIEPIDNARDSPAISDVQFIIQSDGTPASELYGDVYYSRENGPAESEYVFLKHNQLPQRWQTHPRPLFQICELGFGTGLNFFLTRAHFLKCAPENLRLVYYSCEKHPLTLEQMQAGLPDHAILYEGLQSLSGIYPVPIHGHHRLIMDAGRVILQLLYGDAALRLQEFMPDVSYPAAGIDCWYLDGFAPARNPDLWSVDIFAALSRLSAADATAATYSVAGVVRRGLEAAGFVYERVAGFGRKKEMLAARRKPADTLRNQL